MYQIAEENGVENLVAGAWGCGVFMQDRAVLKGLSLVLDLDQQMDTVEKRSHLFFVIEIESAIQILKWRGRTNLRKNFQFFPKYTLPFHMVKC